LDWAVELPVGFEQKLEAVLMFDMIVCLWVIEFFSFFFL
jgi:hypothetical protein